MSIVLTLHTKTPQDVRSCCFGWATVEHVHLPMAGHFRLTRALSNVKKKKKQMGTKNKKRNRYWMSSSAAALCDPHVQVRNMTAVVNISLSCVPCHIPAPIELCLCCPKWVNKDSPHFFQIHYLEKQMEIMLNLVGSRQILMVVWRLTMSVQCLLSQTAPAATS